MMPIRAVRPGRDVLAQRERAERVVPRHAVEARDYVRRLSVYRVLVLLVLTLLLHFEA